MQKRFREEEIGGLGKFVLLLLCLNVANKINVYVSASKPVLLDKCTYCQMIFLLDG